MAIPNYAYMKMKIPGPRGIITVHGDLDKSIECEQGNAVYAENAVSVEELEKLKLEVDPADMTSVKRPTLETGLTFQSAQDTKRIYLVPGSSAQQAVLGAHMDEA